jgi:MATE family multidrug resistance protein
MSNEPREAQLPWAAHPFAQLFRLTWPIAISMLSYSTLTLVDTLFVSRLGASALAGVGLAGIATWVMICFPLGLMRGAKVLVSQAVGAGDEDQVGQVLGAAVAWALSLGVLMVGLSQVAGSLLYLLSASDGAGVAGVEYFRLRMIGTPVVLLFWGLREVRQGLGDTRSPMIASVVANLCNVALDYALIFGLGLGVAGAALASVVAIVIEAVVLLGFNARSGLRARFAGGRYLAALWWLGWPSGLQMLIEIGCFTVLSVMISRFSEVHMAAHQIAIQVIHFSFLPAVALAESTSVLAGQAVGARREELVRRVARAALVAGGLYTGACSLVLVVGGAWIAGLFTDSSQLAELTVRLLLIAAIFQVFDSTAMICGGALRGTGDVRFPAVVGTVTAWALTPPAMWLLGYRLGLGAAGGWIGLCAEIVVLALVLWWRLERGTWRAAAERARSMRRTAEPTGPPAVKDPGPPAVEGA